MKDDILVQTLKIGIKIHNLLLYNYAKVIPCLIKYEQILEFKFKYFLMIFRTYIL